MASFMSKITLTGSLDHYSQDLRKSVENIIPGYPSISATVERLRLLSETDQINNLQIACKELSTFNA